jgi:hypothetical protein
MTRRPQPNCKTRIRKELKSRLADLKKLWEIYCKDCEARDQELGHIDDYGLGFDYVAPGTFDDQKEGYFRYQLSWGGPSDEFRIFVNPNFSAHRVEYWFLNWFDGAHVALTGDKLSLLEAMYTRLFVDSGMAEASYTQAMRR